MALAFTLHTGPAADAATLASDCIVVGAFADKTLTATGQALDAASEMR